MFRDKILIATDLSPASLPAIDKGATLARQLGAAVHLLYVYDPTLLSPMFLLPGGATMLPAQDHIDAFEEAIHTHLRQLQSERLPGISRVERHIRQDPSASNGICTAAQQLSAELLVLGTHGRTGIAQAFLGSVAEQVVRHAPCPVLTIRTEKP
jgi:universal stress protein A